MAERGEIGMRIPKMYQNRIIDIYRDDDGIWVTLADGWCYDQQGQHIIHEDTKTEVMKAIRWTEPCHCDECKKGKNPSEFPWTYF